MVLFELVLDNRESTLRGFLKEVTIEPLAVGDFQIRNAENKTPLVIVERKTVADLAASIEDGRYKEQKGRLMATGVPLNRIIFVIEEWFGFARQADNIKISSFSRITYKSLVSSVMNMAIRDGFTVFCTQNISETASLIQGISDRFLVNPDKYLMNADNTYSATMATTNPKVKVRKCENVDTCAVFLSQLSAIPNISLKKAKAIADSLQVNNMTELIKALDGDVTLLKLKNVEGVGQVLVKSISQHLGLSYEEPKKMKRTKT